MNITQSKKLLAVWVGTLSLLACGGAALIIRHKKEAAA